MTCWRIPLRAALGSLPYLRGAASAHPGEPPAPHDLWSAWNLSPFTLPMLLLAGFLYWRGYVRLRRAGARPGGRNRAVVRPWQALCFLWGLLALHVALVSPLDSLGGSLLSAHMAQHLILLVVMAEAFPGYVLPWAFPLEARRRIARWWHGTSAARLLRPSLGLVFTPLLASLLYAGVVWVWHAPGLYQATLTSETVHMLGERGIPVCAHLGLTPQSVNKFGGYLVQGRDKNQANQILKDARALQEAGAELLVLECIPSELAKTVTQRLTIPTIGIGAGDQTDAQVLVINDLLGLTDKPPKFSKNFLLEANDIAGAVLKFVTDVKAGHFPEPQHIFE